MESQGATLSDVTAQKEYGVSRDFIVSGIRAGKLEFRRRSSMGQSLFEGFSGASLSGTSPKLGSSHLAGTKTQTELRKVKKGDCRTQEEAGCTSGKKGRD